MGGGRGGSGDGGVGARDVGRVERGGRVKELRVAARELEFRRDARDALVGVGSQRPVEALTAALDAEERARERERVEQRLVRA